MDHGSKKRLNWKPTVLDEYKDPELDYTQKSIIINNNKAPVAIGGTYNGEKSGLRPSIPEEINPPLILEKALLRPAKVNPDGSKELSRKRDASGKFAPVQNAGQESSSIDDAHEQERQHRKASLEQVQKLTNSKGSFSQKSVDPSMAGLPNMSSGAAEQISPSQNQGTIIGQTQMGMPIYDDPYHPEHRGFTPEDHQLAAQLHQQIAQSGDPIQGPQAQQKAGVHQDLAMDAQSPMERATSRLGQVSKNLNPFDWFFQQQHAGQAGGEQNTINPQMQGMPNSGQGSPPLPGMPNQAGGIAGGTDSAALSPMSSDQGPLGSNQNKPMNGTLSPRQGPAPGMMNTFTGLPMGPQTNPGALGGPNQMPLELPPSPYGAQQNQANMPQQPVPGLPPPSPDGSSPQQNQFMGQFGGNQTAQANQAIQSNPMAQEATPGVGMTSSNPMEQGSVPPEPGQEELDMPVDEGKASHEDPLTQNGYEDAPEEESEEGIPFEGFGGNEQDLDKDGDNDTSPETDFDNDQGTEKKKPFPDTVKSLAKWLKKR